MSDTITTETRTCPECKQTCDHEVKNTGRHDMGMMGYTQVFFITCSNCGRVSQEFEL